MRRNLATEKRSDARIHGTLRFALIAAMFVAACSAPEASSDLAASTADTTTIRAALNLSGTWVAQGPAPMIHGQASTVTPNNPVTGAIHAVAPHPTNANIVYAGTINGGVWRTDNALAVSPTWRPLTDFLPSLSIGAIALDRDNANVVIAGTGRWSSDANEGGTQGDVLISRDGGANWTVTTAPALAGSKVSGVVIRGNVVLAASIDLVGLFRSTDGGATWTRISAAPGSGLPGSGIDELIEDRQNPNRLYATATRTGVFRSDNLGLTWVNVSQNDPGPGRLAETMPVANAARMSTSSDGRAYIAVVSGPDLDSPVTLVEFTTDGGAHWTAMEQPGVIARGDPFFHFAIGADPTSSNFVYIEGIFSWVRGDATLPESQWSTLTETSFPHADDRDVGFDANGDLIDVSDGGIFRRANPRITGDWFSLAGNLQDAEIHHMAYDQNSRIIFGGTQDNGTIFQTATGSLSWDLAQGGDGGDVAVDVLTNPGFSIRYISSQFLGGFNRATYNASNVAVSTTFVALSGGAIQPQFYTPIELNRVNPLRIALAASDAVYESFNQGDTVTSIGGPQFGHSMFYGHPLNADLIWLSAGGTIWRRLSGTGPLVVTPTHCPCFDDRDVVVDPADVRRAYFAAGFDGVFLTPDGGSSWTNITGNLFTTFNPGAVRAIEFIPSTPQSAVVVGTDRGVFATTTGALGTWQEIGRLPHAPVFDMEYNPRDDLLVVSTLGRGSFSVQGLGGGGANQPPVARCRDVAVDAAAASCRGTVTAADVDAGTTDPDNDPFTCVLVPTGTFAVGTTSVTLSCTDNRGANSTCSATVAVGPGDSPACCPAGTNVIVGNSNNNVLTGTAGRDCIIGLGGQDTINGLGGDDIISAGDGTDTVSGGLGNDLIFGGAGQDQLNGDAGNDVVAGGEGDDRCFGGDGADRLFGGNGQDQLNGDAGNDRLFGNGGDDNLSGGDGDDLLDGGGLHDVCTGGPGTDTFLMCQTQTQ
jgi:Ca2+-binding RTX toxin-like protein